MHMKMSSMVFNSVVLPLWLSLWSPLFSFYMSPHVIIYSTNCAILVILLCITLYFGGATYLVLCGIENVFLPFAIIIISSHNIIASLCYCNVNCCIPMVTILRYDYKFALNIIIKKLFVVGICKPRANF
jgi:hypothetical protein